MQFNLGIKIKKITLGEVLNVFYKYVYVLGFNGNLKSREWYGGYVCALRDAEIIDHDTWDELIDRINDDRLFKAMDRYNRATTSKFD